MNRPENVPIATLSGIASLTEVAGQLPLPTSTALKRELNLYTTPQVQHDSKLLSSLPATEFHQLEGFTQLLATVNTAYLDFKNSSHNRQSYLQNNPASVPPILQQVFQSKPDILQPHYDDYHGSPLKSNAASALAYSTNQRNAFIYQQQYQQHQHLRAQPSPLLTAGSQFSSSNASSSPMKSPHVQQFFKANNMGNIQSPSINYNNLNSPKFFQPHVTDTNPPGTPKLSHPPILHNNAESSSYNNAESSSKHSFQQQQSILPNKDNFVPESPQNIPLNHRPEDHRPVGSNQHSNQVNPIINKDPTNQNTSSVSNENTVHTASPSSNEEAPQYYSPLQTRRQRHHVDTTIETVKEVSLTPTVTAQEIKKNLNLEGAYDKQHKATLKHRRKSKDAPNDNLSTHVTHEAIIVNHNVDQNIVNHNVDQNITPETDVALNEAPYNETIKETEHSSETYNLHKSEKRKKKYKMDKPNTSTTHTISTPVNTKSSSTIHANNRVANTNEIPPLVDSNIKPNNLSVKNINNSSIQNNTKHHPEQRLELRVPKLIVRKIRKIEGDNEIETLEVYSPEKARQYNFTPQVSYTDLPKERRRSKRSTCSSVTSKDSDIVPARKSKKRQELEDDSSDDQEDYSTSAAKKFKPALDDYETSVNNGEVKVEMKKFIFLVEKLLDHELELEDDGNLDLNEDSDIPPEVLMPHSVISSLSTEMAKMKASGKLREMPVDKLVRIISIMDRHVRDTMQLTISEEGDEEEGRKWYNMQVERISRSAQAAAVILLITTAPDMPKQVYLEEALDHVVTLCHHHLEATIYPEFDPIYKMPSDLKDSGFATKSKRSRFHGTKNKHIIQVYNKFCVVVSLLNELMLAESLTDAIILKMSDIGVAPFFVEHVNVLQLEALKVVRTVFRNYVKHRDLILKDILASLTRLPSTKRNLRNYRLRGDNCIQMFTALVLQLVQCTVQIPNDQTQMESSSSQDKLVDKDVLIVKSYEDAIRASQNFISVFLKKCHSSKEDDYRPLFENFLQDLFIVANYPEWPAAEVLLKHLARLFVATFNNAKLELPLRSSALDYMAQIVTYLRKKFMKNEEEGGLEKLKSVIAKLINTNENDDIPVVEDMDIYEDTLRKELLLFLQSSNEEDESFKFAREFYLGQWIRDVQMEIEKSMISPMMSIPGAATKSGEQDADSAESKELSTEKLQILQEKKEFFHKLIKLKLKSNLKSSHRLNYESACTVVDFLASSRPFSQNFDLYLQRIFKMLTEQAIALRTKALKALTMIVAVDSSILAREDVQANVHSRLLDPSTNVREAAVDLIGQFILQCPKLIEQYYSMIKARILDTGVSVRKRVIKILRDICIELPTFEKIPEICSTMIRRVNDEIGIKKLVTDVFRLMWFQPVSSKSRCSDELYQKAVNITKVVALSKDIGFEWLESLLESLLDPENQYSKTSTLTACQQLVDCLFSRLLTPELKADSNAIISCLITLYVFCKTQPTLLVAHAATLQPYLSSKVNNKTDELIVQHVSKMLELVVPLMNHPSPKFLADLEEASMALMLQQSPNTVQACASFLSAVINRVTHDYKFIIEGFTKFLKFLTWYRAVHEKRPADPLLKSKRTTLLRALYTVGLLCRHFDLDVHIPPKNTDTTNSTVKNEAISEQVFNLCMYFADLQDEEISLKAILAIGFVGIRYPQLLLHDDCLRLYQDMLSPVSKMTKAKCTVLKNLQNHLMEEENRLQEAEKVLGVSKKSKKKKNEESPVKTNIKEMGDASSSTTSELIQMLLSDIMKCFIHNDIRIRVSALQVISIILRQGLIHPAQCIPYLIAISTDKERLCHVKAEQCLTDLDSRHQGFIHQNALQGVKTAYEIQKVIQKNDGNYLCGYRENESKLSLCNHVYSMIRSNKQFRRPFLLSLLKLLDDKRAAMDLKYFVSENIAYLSFNTHEEPLFLIHHIDTSASVVGPSILLNFKELFNPKGSKTPTYDSDDEGEDNAAIKNKDINMDELWKLVKSSFGCMLLLELKQYLKTLFGFTDGKCQKYSPSEPSKLYDKTLTRKTEVDFTSDYKELMFSSQRTHEDMINYYYQFKNLMNSLDREELSDSELDKSTSNKKENTNNDSDTNQDQPTENPAHPVEDIQPVALPVTNTTSHMNGVIKLPAEIKSLPALKIDIPLIPLKILTDNAMMQGSKKRMSSRRSSRSSRGSAAQDL